jgi:hypothetical protein
VAEGDGDGAWGPMKGTEVGVWVGTGVFVGMGVCVGVAVAVEVGVMVGMAVGGGHMPITSTARRAVRRFQG